MSASSKWIFIVIFLFGCTNSPILAVKVEPYSSQAKARQSISLNQPGIASTFKRFEENAPTIIKLLQAICEILFAGLWILDTTLNGFLWVLNETVRSCTDFCIRIFGILFNIVKILEAFGFGVKFLLELNYAVLSYIFDIFGCAKESFSDVITLVKITIVNQTEHVYDSSFMALEGVQNLFITACNQTWVNIQCFSTLVTTNFTLPFGLSAFDSSLVATMLLTVLEFFVQSLKLTGELFKDGNVFVFTYICNILRKIGANVIACLCFITDVVTMVITQIVYTVIWPFYFLASIISNISSMLYYSWEAFVIWLGDLDTMIRELVHMTFRVIGAGTSGLVDTVTGCLSSIIYSISRCLSGLVYSIIGVTSTLVYGITGFIDAYVPGGIFGCIILASLLVVLYLWHKEIISLLVSSWISLRLMNVNARQVGNNFDDDQPFHDEHVFEDEGEMDIPVRNMQEPPSDGEMPQNQTKLKYELELEKDKRLCVICQDNFKNILLLPCRHVCMCQQCLHEIREGHVQLAQCPLCRTHIQSTLEVFV